jgi:hypothetical protein
MLTAMRASSLWVATTGYVVSIVGHAKQLLPCQQARHLEDHLVQAPRMSALCSNDPICAQHVLGKSLESRWLHGAACHGCALVAETSCEMGNDYLERALVVPMLGIPDAAFSGYSMIDARSPVASTR